MSYFTDDSGENAWEDDYDQRSYDQDQKELSDYNISSQEEENKLKTNNQSEDDKEIRSKGFGSQETDSELQSIQDFEEQNLTLMDFLPENKKQELGLCDDFANDDLRPNEVRISSPFISKYEKAMVIGKRAQQISKNSPIYVNMTEDEIKRLTALEIAEIEFEMDKIPILIRRYLPDRTFEDWKLSELRKLSW